MQNQKTAGIILYLNIVSKSSNKELSSPDLFPLLTCEIQTKGRGHLEREGNDSSFDADQHFWSYNIVPCKADLCMRTK